MKLAAIFAACAALGFGQATITSCSPGTCTATTASISMAQYGFKPSAVQINITAPSTWTVTAGSAPFSFAAADGSGPLTSGTGPLAVVMKGSNAIEALSVGVHTYPSGIVVAGTTLNVTVTVVNNYIRPAFSNALGVADSAIGCTKPTAANPFYQFGVPCATTNARPGGNFTMPTYGNSVTDSQLGSSYKNCAPTPLIYTGLNAWWYDGSMIFAGGGAPAFVDDGITGLYSATCSGGRLYPAPHQQDPTLAVCQPFRTISGLFCTNGASASIYKAVPAIAPNYTVTTLWTEPHGKPITYGNSAAPSADDNFVVFTIDLAWMHVVNLATGATVASLDFTSFPETFTSAPDYVAIMPATDGGCHDIVGAVDPNPDAIKANRWFRQCGSTISFVGLGPFFPDGITANTATFRNPCTVVVAAIIYQCFGGSTGNHAGVVSAGGKNIFMQRSIYQPGGDEVYFSSGLQMSVGTTLASTAKVLGGGLNTTTNIGGDMAGAASAPYIAYSNAFDGPIQAYTVLTATPGTNVVTVTFTPDPALGGVTNMVCGSITGITNFVNATYAVTPLGGGSYRFPLTGAAGAYTAGGACALDTALSASYVSQEIQIARLSTKDGHPIQIQRVLRHHHIIYTTDTLTYVWMSFKADGSKLLFQSNGGFPYSGSGVGSVPIYVVDNPCTATADNELCIAGDTVIAAPSTITALFTGLAPSAADVSIDVSVLSTSPGCQSPVTTITLTGGAVFPTPRTATASGLTSSTAYHWCASADNKYYAEGDFTTGSGASSTGIGLGGASAFGGKIAVGP